MSDDVIFEPLPPDARTPSGWRDKLRTRPGEWARLPLAWSAVTRLNRDDTRGEFEFVARRVDGKRVLYGRYIGGES